MPEHTRIQSILWSYMENYKKDQDVYVTGEEPDKFYIILTGQVCKTESSAWGGG